MDEECCGTNQYATAEVIRYPEPPQAVRWHPITIKRVTNGFIVEVGCRTFVKENWRDVVEGITKYWKDPLETEKEYCSKP